MNDIQFHKIVTAQEMKRLESLDMAKGASAEAFMRQAGKKVAEQVASYKKIVILIGKGNNGGDGYAAGLTLLKKGAHVSAFALYPLHECSPLNQKLHGEFVAAGGEIVPAADFSSYDLILDGLLGTGFHGEIGAEVAQLIDAANRSEKKIVAIDIPSGLNGTTGEGKRAIIASETIALGFAKIGFFLRDGWNCVGKVKVVSFGLSQDAIHGAKGVALSPHFESLSLPKMGRESHKYQRGFVVGFGGSKAFPGAVKMSGLAALHSGAGIVKIFSQDEIGEVPMELISQVWNEPLWREALQKAQAVFIGPGLGRGEKARGWLHRYLKLISPPCVIDADALFYLNELMSWPKQTVLTPHRGEMLHLLGHKEMIDEEPFLKECALYAQKKKTVLVVKGAPTFLFLPNHLPIIVARGDAGMATAGSGDVLTGVIAALIAQGETPEKGALLGVVLHAIAGEETAKKKTSYAYTATDLIASLPDAFRALLK